MPGAGGAPIAREPRVLLVSGLYPSPANPVFGAFVARQHEAFERLGVPHRLVVNRRWRPGALRAGAKYASLLVRAIAAALRRDHDVVLGHFLYPTAAIARVAARASGTPYVLVAHGTDVGSLARGGAVGRACVRAAGGAAAVVAVSHALAGRLRDEIGLPASVPVPVVNMGVDRRVFRPLDGARAQMGWADGERVALFAGNLVDVKAPLVLVDAFARLKRAGGCDRLVFAGDGPLRAAIGEAARASGVAGSVELAGRLAPERLALAMNAADVFVLPSLAEALGLVLLEAMACGTPCVGSRVGGIPEVLAPECGALAQPGDAGSLAEAMRGVLEAGKDTYRQACLDAAAANDLDANAARVVEILRDAIDGTEAGR